MENIQSILMDYERQDIYNMDETGLFWRRSPNCTLSTTAEPGIKQSKERITAMMCGNAYGSDKIPIWIIGRAMNPRAFKNMTKRTSLGCIWRANSTAWNNTVIIRERLVVQFPYESKRTYCGFIVR